GDPALGTEVKQWRTHTLKICSRTRASDRQRLRARAEGGTMSVEPVTSYIRGARSGRPFTIKYDVGGGFQEYVDATQRLRATGAPVTVTGSCISGCTLALSLPKSQVRVSPNARFLIHGAYVQGSRQQVPWVTRRMVGMYRPEVQEIIRRRGGVPPGWAG